MPAGARGASFTLADPAEPGLLLVDLELWDESDLPDEGLVCPLGPRRGRGIFIPVGATGTVAVSTLALFFGGGALTLFGALVTTLDRSSASPARFVGDVSCLGAIPPSPCCHWKIEIREGLC